MDIIGEELIEIKKSLVQEIHGCELISCHKNLVIFKLTKTKSKCLTASIQFPQNYPDEPLLTEIKSKVFSSSLTNMITEICDKEAKKHTGKKQVLLIARFLEQFLDENPLLPCRDEWTYIKKHILQDSDQDRVRQKKGLIEIKVLQEKYFIKIQAIVPNNYPEESVKLTMEEHNFPDPMAYFFICQAKEFARQATEPSLNRNGESPPFQAEPHLRKVLEFLITKCCKRFPQEHCPICKEKALPSDPNAIVLNSKEFKYIERMYCGHLFHHGCLDQYMKTPPFEKGKNCPKCGLHIYHEKWNISSRLAEKRWAQKQARQRELDEVIDFLS